MLEIINNFILSNKFIFLFFWVLYGFCVLYIIHIGLASKNTLVRIFGLIYYLCFTLSTLLYVKYNVWFLVIINLVLCLLTDFFIVQHETKKESILKKILITMNNIYIIIVETILYGSYYCISMPEKYIDEINNIVNKESSFILKYFASFWDFIDIAGEYYFKPGEDLFEYPYPNIMGVLFFATMITVMFENININIFPQE